MPSQSPGCFVNRYDETYTLWEHWREAVTHMRAGGGCNDLIFSGHASVLTFTVLMHADLGAPRWLVAFLWGRLGHAFLRIVQSRSHLSVDVVVACILALLLWHVLPEVQPHPKAFTSKGLSPEAIGWSSALCGAVAVLLALLGAPAAGPLSELNRRRLSQVAAAPSDSQEPPRIFCAMINVSDEFIDKYLDGDVSYGYWKLPERPDYVTRATLGRLEDRGPWPTTLLFREQSDLTIGYANARDMMEIMYEASKVPGVFEKIPDPLKGVFWMKGNGVGEELLVLQYSQYYEKEKVMLTPLAPFMWAWPNGAPPDAPFGGFMYGPTTTKIGARLIIGDGKKPAPGVTPPSCLSFNFQDEKHGILQGHSTDLRVDTINVGTFVPFCPCLTCIGGKFTLEALESPSAEPGSSWKRGCFWGPCNCKSVEFGSYNLVKVITGDGKPNEPYYSEFIKYMGDVRLFCWTGLTEQ
ncbi:unnamed protein product [Effrenium voratum]|nr:unnamed protein product [Effrenium voratum]